MEWSKIWWWFFQGLGGFNGWSYSCNATIWDSLTKGFESYEKDGDIADAIDNIYFLFF